MFVERPSASRVSFVHTSLHATATKVVRQKRLSVKSARRGSQLGLLSSSMYGKCTKPLTLASSVTRGLDSRTSFRTTSVGTPGTSSICVLIVRRYKVQNCGSTCASTRERCLIYALSVQRPLPNPLDSRPTPESTWRNGCTVARRVEKHSKIGRASRATRERTPARGPTSATSAARRLVTKAPSANTNGCTTPATGRMRACIATSGS